MDSDQIERAIAQDPATNNIFGGVYPRDDFILLNIDEDTEDVLFICNLDNCNKPGSHWIVIERHRRDILYFDSYGLPPIHQDLTTKLINMTQSNITWNNTPLQDNTNVCGQYCIVYCLLRARQVPFKDIIKTLQHNDQLSKHIRDHVVATIINQRFGTLLPKLTQNIHDIEQFILP
jgi:hypothetical protein